MKQSAKNVTLAAIIAAVYISVTFIFAPISFGYIQLRVSEALTVLPVFTPAAIPGLFVGCMLSNLLIGGLGWIDFVFGSLATLIAAFLTYKLRKNTFVALIPPVVVNAVIVGTYLGYLIYPGRNYMMSILFTFIGQLLSCYGFGYPLSLLLKKTKNDIFR